MICACPKCGGASGYYTKRRVTLKTWFDFDHEADDSAIERDKNSTGQIYYCSDCNKNISAYVAALKGQTK